MPQLRYPRVDASDFISDGYRSIAMQCGRQDLIVRGFSSKMEPGACIDSDAFNRFHASLDTASRKALWLASGSSPSLLMRLYATGRLLNDGPKAFFLNDEQFESFQHVDLRLTCDEYEQPFPAMAVYLPPAARKAGLPRSVLLMHHRATRAVGAFAGCLGRDVILGEVASVPTRSLEECFTNGDLQDAAPERGAGEWSLFHGAVRVAVNAMLLLTRYQRTLRPLDPDLLAKLARPKRNLTPRQVERIAITRQSQYEVVEFAQEITVREVIEGPSNGSPTGVEMPAHWRRGHWRRQPCGPLSAERRLTFVRPVLVRADRFTGSMANTAATYFAAAGGH